jgi:uncharacterized protein
MADQVVMADQGRSVGDRPMRVSIEQVREAPVEWREVLVLTPEQIEGSHVVELGVVDCRGRLSAIEDGILIQGELSYDQTMTCNRCLEPVQTPVRESFDLLVVTPGEESAVALDLELEEADLDVVAVEGDELDTDPLVVEQIHLNVPMKPLCSEECKGLCPSCGSNLNEGPCACPADVDPRWAALASLRDRGGPRN